MVQRIVLPLCASLMIVPLPAFAAITPVPATLNVVGHASVQRAPERAIIRAEIVVSGKSADDARMKNDAITQRAVSALTAMGIPARSVRTANFRSTFIPRGKDMPADAMTGYISRRDLEITTTPDQVEAVTHALTDSDVHEIDGVSTDVVQKRSAYQDTLAAAMNDAATQAQVIARAAHVRLVRIVTLDATNAPVFAPRMQMMGAMKSEVSAPAVADVELSASVNVTYEIAPF